MVEEEGEEAWVVEGGGKAGLQRDREGHVYAPNAVTPRLTHSVHLATNKSVQDAEPQ